MDREAVQDRALGSGREARHLRGKMRPDLWEMKTGKRRRSKKPRSSKCETHRREGAWFALRKLIVGVAVALILASTYRY